MEMLQIEAQIRDQAGTTAANVWRNKGYLPGILYGHGGENIALALPQKEIMKYFASQGRILDLQVGGKSERAMLKDVQYDSLGDEVIHVDLVRIRLDEVVSISVPVKVVGVPGDVEAGNATQDVIKNDIQVKCLPTAMPQFIEVNVAELTINETLHLKDVSLPEGVELDEDPENPVVSVSSKVVEPEPEEESAEGVEGAEGEGSGSDDEGKGKKE